jgi:GTPase SAR1 family protein
MIISNKKEYKVVIIGEGRVGKTSIMIRFVEDKFNIKQQTTVNASYLQKTVTIEGNSATLNIWVPFITRTPPGKKYFMRSASCTTGMHNSP